MDDAPNDNHQGRTAAAAPSPKQCGRRGVLPLIVRTVTKAWRDNIFSESAAAAFWETLSLPPLLLGLLGSLGFIGDWFGPAVVEAAHGKMLALSRTIFSANVVDGIIGPTVSDILTKGRSEIVSVGFLLSLWAGSSALASLVDSITLAYDQYLVRHSVWQRIFALLLYLVALVLAVVGLPVIALGPETLSSLFPPPLQPDVAGLVRALYYPATGIVLVLALATLYKVALPKKLPWHRGLPGALLAMVVFLCTSTGLRLYIAWVTSTGYTYGALATPIAYLLFAFFIAFAIIIGAEFNNAIQEMWPAPIPRRQRRRIQAEAEPPQASTDEPARSGDDSAAREHADHTERNGAERQPQTRHTRMARARSHTTDDRSLPGYRSGKRYSSPPGGSDS